ncbi:MAG: hypothetical protein QOJ94_2009 [Sphingomonadales bacterium]|nr:hypothetical protein [Sphingomonadales bacterium]
MSTPLHASRPAAAADSRIQLMLKTPAGARWALTVSQGMERFIGHYPRVAGLGSGGPLLRYERSRGGG